MKGEPRTAVLAFILAFAALATASCGDDGGRPAVTAGEVNEEAWERYLQGDYAGARSLFIEALDLNPKFIEARLGLAWSDAQVGEYGSSVSGFDSVIASGEYVTDAFAGRAAATLELPDYSLSIASADSALARDREYVFARQSAYNFGDLRLILAQAHYALAQYESAQNQVDLINPDNGLDPEDPESWVVAETSYPTYEAALAVFIELLWSLEGGL